MESASFMLNLNMFFVLEILNGKLHLVNLEQTKKKVLQDSKFDRGKPLSLPM